MKTRFVWIGLVLLGVLLLAGCNPGLGVGALRTESRTVELRNDAAMRVDINFGAGDLRLAGGADKLLEADFTYNVARLKPEVKYTAGALVIRQPEARGLPDLRNITDFRNEWDVRLYDETPMALKVNVGGGTSDLRLADLSLTRLDLSLGAGTSTLDLNGDWARDLDVTVDSGAANISVRLPQNVGVRVEVDAGPTVVDAPDMTKNGNVYTNAAYGASNVTLRIKMDAGVGWINLDVVE